MPTTNSLFFAIITLILSPVLALNDWSQPCFDGICTYYASPDANTMAGAVTITGHPFAISDITPAAGWEIVGCNPDALAQDIRIVCQSTNTADAGCDHLFQNGAENTIVRLPENCGKNAFARVAKASVSADQSIPQSIARRLHRRATDTSAPQVHAITIDTDFGAIGDAQPGNVTVHIYGSSVPSATGDSSTNPTGRRDVIGVVGSSLQNIKRDAASNGVAEWDLWNKTTSTTIPVINIDSSYNLFNASVDCGDEKASIDVNAHTKVFANVTLGIFASGLLVPPIITNLSAFAGVTSSLDATLTLDASATGHINTGIITLYTAAIPALNFPGILTVGPAFKVNAKAIVDVDIALSLDVNLNYNVDKLQMIFPPNGNSSVATLSPEDSPLKLSVDTNVISNGHVEAHLIPTLDLGITALSGMASATVYLDVDAMASMDLALNASASAVAQAPGVPNTALANGTSSTQGEVNGCVDLEGGVSVNAGAQASFFSLWSAGVNYPIYAHQWTLYKNCFAAANSTSTKRSRLSYPSKRAALNCSALSTNLTTLVDTILPSSSFTSL
ncbi:hypothetical protein BD410DRAFT_308836 [Rickenella mellea]|uniref:Uncharacterized protein n=1 Tax=Rickenella mellea TaxID=50990 RepID=A0A4Y7Q0R1_9AGAM|nr:hypothetical protein BD410DRAFT_308836 [Rickenella mellea]